MIAERIDRITDQGRGVLYLGDLTGWTYLGTRTLRVLSEHSGIFEDARYETLDFPKLQQTMKACLGTSNVQATDWRQVRVAGGILWLPEEAPADARITMACNCIAKHFEDGHLTRDIVAALANLSPSYFSKLFQEEVGTSFSDYLIQTRIENAKGLLRRFDLSVAEIGRLSGFNSLAHFSRTFKERAGTPPLRYRMGARV